MAYNNSPERRAIVERYANDHTDLNKSQLAERLFNDFPQHFKNFEQARSMVKLYFKKNVPSIKPVDMNLVFDEKKQWDEKEQEAYLELNVTKEVVTTLEKALEIAEVDLEIWEVERHIFNSWMVTMKDSEGEPIARTNYQVKIWFRRKVYNGKQWAEDLYKSVKGLIEKPAPPIKRANTLKGNLLELDLFDPHFGKYATKDETNDPYDLTIAKERYSKAINKLVTLSEPHGVNKILYVLGNDHFHFDNWDNTTTKGTPQDTHLRWTELWTNGCQVAIDNIRMLRQIAPVDVVMVPSNHDWQNVFKLGFFLHTLFENDKYVNIDWRPISRKYYRYGKVGLGFTHGNEEKHASLPMLMLREMQKEWADVAFMEWHIGHLHTEKKMEYKSVNETNGIVVRFMRSLSGTDFWHYKNGYVGNIKGAEAFVWNANEGMVGNFRANL